MNSLAEMLRMAGSSDDDRNDTCYRPDPMAQAMELRERFAGLNDVATFKPGDLVRSKVGIGHIKDTTRIVFLVQRVLVPGNTYDDLLLAEHVDEMPMQIAAIAPDLVCLDLIAMQGKGLAGHLLASCRVEHLTDADLAAWTLPK
jgi:hypothetical protein